MIQVGWKPLLVLVALLAVARAAQVSAEIERSALTGTVQQVAVVQPAAIEPFPLYYPAKEFDRPYTGPLIFVAAKDTTEVQEACKGSGPALGCTLLVCGPMPGYSGSRRCHQGPWVDHRSGQAPRDSPLQRLATRPSWMAPRGPLGKSFGITPKAARRAGSNSTPGLTQPARRRS